MNVNLYSFKLLLFKFLANSRNGMFFNAKHSVRIFTLFSLSLVFTSCEEGLFDAAQPDSELSSNCLEVKQFDDKGVALERIYKGSRITKLQVSRNDTLRYYYDFTYDSNGRIVQSQYANALNPTAKYVPEIITYDDKGKWVASTFTYSNGDEVTRAVEYDAQDQIHIVTISTTKSGNTTVNSTATYTWEGGNITKIVNTSPTSQRIVDYKYDLEVENKRQQAQEKLAFFYFNSLELAHNANMLKQKEITLTRQGTTTKTISEYNYELNEQGYPDRLELSTTYPGYTYPFSENTYFEYECN